MKISEIITDKYKLRIEPTVYYDLLADVREAEEKQEPCEDAVSKQGVAKILLKYVHNAEGKAFAEFLLSQINALPSVTPQEPCEDAISRQAVDTLVDELARAISDERCCMPRGRSTGAIMQDILDLPPVTPQEPFDDTILTLTKTLTKRVVTQVTEDMDNFIFTTIKPWCEAKEQRIISKRDLEQALTQYFSKEPCEDAISRQAVLDSIHANCVYENEYNLTAKHIEDAVKQLPPVTPQPKTGQWMFVDKAKEHARCSECGYGDVDLFNGKPHNYCEKCGVKMESEVQS